MNLKELKIKDILKGIETYIEEEYNTIEGNSFFFTGGCYMFADAIYLSLKEIGIKSKILTFGEGEHNFVRAKGFFIDANGGSKTIEELVSKAGFEDISEDINYCGLVYSEKDKEVNEYKDNILKYAYLECEKRLKKEIETEKIDSLNNNEIKNNENINKIFRKPLQP